MVSLRYACTQSSGIIPITQATFVLTFVSFAASIAEPAHGEKLHTQSLSLFDALGNEALALRNKLYKYINLL